MTDDPWDDTETLALCATDPHTEGMRQLLLTLESDAHQRGWDHSDNQHKLFEVTRGEDLFGLRMAGPLQVMFDVQCDRRDGNVGVALLDVAEATRWARQYMDTEPDTDLYTPELEGTTIYGWGLLAEVFMLDSANLTPEQEQTAREASGNHEIHLHPNRIEGRMIYLVCRDGNYWTVVRQRGKAAVAVVTKPESLALETAGNVPYGLGRMLNAIVSNPVPVPARGGDFWRDQGRS